MALGDGPQPRTPPAPPQPWHALGGDEALRLLGVESAVGLSPGEAGRRLQSFGPNALPEPPRRSALALVLRQFKSPLIYLLLGAAGLSAGLGDLSDAAVIGAVVLLNAAVGALQEGRAERALAALRRLTGQRVSVLRAGSPAQVQAREIVPGDLLLLGAGDAIVADARLLEGAALQVAEAALTGESTPVRKAPDVLPPDAGLAERRNLLFAGTFVTAGRGRALVVATGVQTEIGRIASLAEASERAKTPLEQRIERFGRQVMIVAVVLFGVILALGVVRRLPLGEIAMVAISQVVGLVPEGLPVAMTIALAVGVQRMARRRAVVRRLGAVETLGATTVICTDKTGTLTRNEMTVTELVLPGRAPIAVSGVGYAPAGRFEQEGSALSPEADAGLRALLEAGALCNDASVGPGEGGEWRAVGDPTEAALVVLAMKAGIDPVRLRAQSPRSGEIPFDPANKLMATEHPSARGPRVLLKGAPEVLLELCREVLLYGEARPLDAAARREVQAAAQRMAERALRVLALGRIEQGGIDAARGVAGLAGRVTLLGLVGQIDPPRPEAAGAVARCASAGIRPVMITGDHQATGVAIGRALGILGPGDEAMGGRELERLSDAELAARVARVAVFARVLPAQKLRIVEALRAGREVVAMTGDGVNDAPALARADVGVAMGIAGTEVAKEASEIVVTDDNFATIVDAVEEGRVVYRNIKKALLFLVTTSLAEVGVLLGAMFLGLPLPFAPVQILWNNLVTEGVITINLVMDPPEGDEMVRRPIPAGEPLLSRALILRLMVMTPAIVVSTLGWFSLRIAAGVPWEQVRSETFTLLVVCEWFNVLNCNSETRSVLGSRLWKNPWLLAGLLVGNVLQVAVIYLPALNPIFYTTPLALTQVLAVGAAGSLVLWVEELRKWGVRRGRLKA